MVVVVVVVVVDDIVAGSILDCEGEVKLHAAAAAAAALNGEEGE